mmetsp:Transcript_34417/g.83257  ORF Transcript_34417/g.83257 Transcript_34417/m.83257 type:complete len:391 (+) Transcript_34417:207-1379(+)
MKEATTTSHAPSPAGGNDNAVVVDVPPPPLSKNQLKKRRRCEKLHANTKRKKDKKRDLKRVRAEAAGRDLHAERLTHLRNAENGKGWRMREERWKDILKGADIDNSFRVCFDCSFEDRMTWKEANSLGLQLRDAYAMNRKSARPVYIDVCGMKDDGQTRGHLRKQEGFPERWVGRAFRCYGRNLEVVYNSARVFDIGDDASTGANNDDNCEQTSEEKVNDGRQTSYINDDNEDAPNNNSGKEPHPKLKSNHQFVYLTADSPNTLTTLDDNTTYIIGGIVDRNRLKRAAIDRAEIINALKNPLISIKTARLPLDKDLDSKGSTRVLTCNHVFGILQKFRENDYKEWRSSIVDVLSSGRDDKEEKNECKDGGTNKEKDNCADAENQKADDKG